MDNYARENKALLARQIFLTRLNIIAERLWSLLLIPLSIIGLFIALSWLSLFQLFPFWVNYGLFGLFIITFVISLAPILKFKWPTRDEIERRLEQDNHIAHEGIAIYSQQLEQSGDAEGSAAKALWNEHQRRMRAKLKDLRMGAPRSDVPARDPYALRIIVVMLLVTGFAYSYSGQSGQMSDIFASPQADNDIVDNLRMDAWVSPPSYVNRAPIFLTSRAGEEDAIAIPEQSEIVVRLSGRDGEEIAPYFERAGGIKIPLDFQIADQNAPANSYETFTYRPEQDGRLLIGERWRWDFHIIKDAPPEITFEAYPEQALNGAMEITYKALDDYGVVEAWAEIVPVIPPDDHAVPLYEKPKFALDLPRRANADGIGFTMKDLTDHPLAGQDVVLTLYAKDGADQIAQSQDLEITLPMRPFSSPLALSILEQRQVLAFDAYDLPRAIELNDALTILPEETIPNLSDYLLIKTAREGLSLAYSEQRLREWVDNLWNIALILEDGELSLAEQRLKQAQEALQNALENGASDDEIAQLMDELREAMNEYLQALMQQNNLNQPNQNQQANNAQEMEVQDLNDFLDQIEDMARSGNRDQAQQMLDQLQNMMNNMQASRNQGQQDGEPSPMEQQLEQLGDILRQQQELMDETFGLQQEQRRQRQQQMDNQRSQNNQQQQPNQPNQNGEQQPMTAQELADALERLRQQQDALGEQLQDLQDQMAREGMQPNEGLGEAGDAMGQATGELGRGQTENAGEQQGRALQALRDGAQQMLNEMQEQMQAGQGQQQGEGAQQFGQQQGPGQSGGRDPLGRMQQGQREGMFGQNPNAAFGDGKNVQRARDILDIIRKRLGENFRLELEKQYLERLLQLQQ